MPVKYKNHCQGFLLVVIFLAVAVPSMPQESWLGFAPYPGARQMCEEHVMGSSKGHRVEIHWFSFATRDEQAQVAAFYAQKGDAVAEKDADGTIRLRHDQDRVLSIYPVPGTYPTCEKKVRSDEKTVILVSQRIQ